MNKEEIKKMIKMSKKIPFKMRNVYDLDDYYILKRNGWKLATDNTIRHYKKEQLIRIIRMLEHNWAGELKANMLQNKRLENFYNYCKKIGNSDLFSQIIDGDSNERII